MTGFVYRPRHPMADGLGMVPKDLAGPLHEKHGDMNFMPDIAEFIAPGHVPISSRSALRAYERNTGTRQCGELKTADDFKHTPRPPDQRKIDAAYRFALQKHGFA